MDDDIRALHVDAALLALDKPAGLLAVPGRGADRQDCAVRRAQRRWSDALTVHRLDMDTSGLIVFGRGAAAQRVLSIAFAERRVAKRYVAVVAGTVDADDGSIAAPLIADWPNRPRQIVDRERGKPSLTRWRVLARLDGCTRLDVEPVTGRSHQIRVHLAHIGHPVVGDRLYGGPAAARLLLHASRLSLPHPASEQAIGIDCPPPF